MTDPRFDTTPLQDNDEVKEVVLDSGMRIALRVADARRAPGGWRLASAKGADMLETFERFFAALITPPEGTTIDEVFKKLSVNDVYLLVSLVVPFLAQKPDSIQLPR